MQIFVVFSTVDVGECITCYNCTQFGNARTVAGCGTEFNASSPYAKNVTCGGVCYVSNKFTSGHRFSAL